jgi:hypothetical protein
LTKTLTIVALGVAWLYTRLSSTLPISSAASEDEAGELYVARHGSGGGLYKIVPRPVAKGEVTLTPAPLPFRERG